VAHYQAMVGRLRKAGIPAELYLGGSGMKAQMKYADRRNSVCAVIQGSDERARGEVQVKDLVLGAELAGASADRAAYLKEQGGAQLSVAEADLVDAVRKILARHA
jgi:histidyl-tRNA synthetase